MSKEQAMPEFLPDRAEAGTHNVHGAAGLLEGIRFVRSYRPGQIAAYEGELMAYMGEALNRNGKYRVYAGGRGVLSVIPLETSPEELADKLAAAGVAVRAGLHCAPLAHITAGTIQTGTVRFSASVFNTHREVEQVLELLRK